MAWRLGKGLALAGRAGARTRSRGDAGSRFSLGGALRTDRVALAYAYRGFGALGGVHRVGVDFGASR